MNNTLTGSVDSFKIVNISGGSPTISNNNIIAHVDNGLYPDPPPTLNRFGTEYGVYAENVNGAYITNNRFILPFRIATIQVVSGSATVEGNSELLYNPVSTPPPTPSPTPTILPTPTLPPYPNTSPTPASTPTLTPYQEPQQTEQEMIIGIAVTALVIGAGLGLLLYLIKRK